MAFTRDGEYLLPTNPGMMAFCRKFNVAPPLQNTLFVKLREPFRPTTGPLPAPTSNSSHPLFISRRPDTMKPPIWFKSMTISSNSKCEFHFVCYASYRSHCHFAMISCPTSWSCLWWWLAHQSIVILTCRTLRSWERSVLCEYENAPINMRP